MEAGVHKEMGMEEGGGEAATTMHRNQFLKCVQGLNFLQSERGKPANKYCKCSKKERKEKKGQMESEIKP